MREFAFVVSCSPGYDFGLISCMNAQHARGTNADWEIAEEGFSEERKAAISAAFPFKVNWTPISELVPMLEDRRSDRRVPLERFWISYWLLAHKLLKEKKYKAVCVIQADQFLNTNLDVYFRMAERGIMSSSEYPFNQYRYFDMPFGRDREIWDRGQCAFFDAVNFIGQDHTEMALDCVRIQAEDAFRGEANASIPAMNRSILRHVKPDRILGLEGRQWVCDSIWHETRLVHEQILDRIYRDAWIPIYGWHSRWWQEGRVTAELQYLKSAEKTTLLNCLHNFNFVKKYMERFNNMKPEIASVNFVKGTFTSEGI